jgi:multicomponent Na+:H+ antiporter subunit D
VVGQLQLLMFGAFAFILLISSGYYVPEVKSLNLDADWIYRKLGRFGYRAADRGFNALNRLSEGILMAAVRKFCLFFQQVVAKIALFFAVNLWLFLGYRNRRLAYKKERLCKDLVHGTLPIGVGAAVAISFILVMFIII